MSFLHNLGLKYGTDKSRHIDHKGKSYCDTYHKHFNSIRHEVKNVLEIGVLGNQSLKMWADYFPNATIWGVDINPNVKHYTQDRIKIIIADQNSSEDLKRILTTVGDIDIVIDDGSHINRHIIHSFEKLSPKVKYFYCVEDLHCSYESNNQHDIRKIWSGQKYNDETDDLKNYRQEIRDWLNKEVERIDGRESKFSNINVYNQIFIFQT